MLKTCTKCNEEKPLTEYWKQPGGKWGLTPNCKMCINARNKEFYLNNPDKRIAKLARKKAYEKENPYEARSRKLKYEYGIDLKKWNSMFSDQDGRCAICSRHQSELSYMLQVDHNHNTGKIRSLLCTKCNTKLSAIENGDFLQKATEYLNSFLGDI